MPYGLEGSKTAVRRTVAKRIITSHLIAVIYVSLTAWYIIGYTYQTKPNQITNNRKMDRLRIPSDK